MQQIATFMKNNGKTKRNIRYFFTATPESAPIIEKESKELGIQPPTFIRMIMHQALVQDKSTILKRNTE